MLTKRQLLKALELRARTKRLKSLLAAFSQPTDRSIDVSRDDKSGTLSAVITESKKTSNA